MNNSGGGGSDGSVDAAAAAAVLGTDRMDVDRLVPRSFDEEMEEFYRLARRFNDIRPILSTKYGTDKWMVLRGDATLGPFDSESAAREILAPDDVAYVSSLHEPRALPPGRGACASLAIVR